MKKLMIAAAAAAMIGGAYATDVCTDEDEGSAAGCLVYDLQLKLKTLAPKKIKCKASSCSDCDSVIYYLDNANRTIKGYLWFCDDECWDVDDDVNVVLWDASTKTPIVPIQYEKDETTKKTKYYYDNESLVFTFLGRYAKGANKVAAAWVLDAEDIYGSAAGLNGSVIADKEEGTVMLKSISGNFAGAAVPSLTISSKCSDDTVYGRIADLCTCWESWCDSGDEWDEEVPASGTWTIKYNKKLSTGSTPMFKLVPKYALVDETEV